jgi:hypothetical protein
MCHMCEERSAAFAAETPEMLWVLGLQAAAFRGVPSEHQADWAQGALQQYSDMLDRRSASPAGLLELYASQASMGEDEVADIQEDLIDALHADVEDSVADGLVPPTFAEWSGLVALD